MERVLKKNFSVNGPGMLRLETQGAIRVIPGNAAIVQITATQRIRADTDREADDLLERLELTMEQEGNEVRVVSKYESRPKVLSFGSWPPVQVDFVVTVPDGFSVDLRTSGGRINVGNIDGSVSVRTSGGGITLGKVGGPVVAQTSGGGISLEESRSDVELKTSGGSIAVGRVSGAAELRTSGGSIKIDAVKHAVRAHTSGGSIRAVIVGALKEDSSLSTSGGGVRVTVDPAAAFRLDASSSGGSVETRGLKIASENASKQRRRIVGAVNGGGPQLKLRSSGGGIVVRTD